MTLRFSCAVLLFLLLLLLLVYFLLLLPSADYKGYFIFRFRICEIGLPLALFVQDPRQDASKMWVADVIISTIPTSRKRAPYRVLFSFILDFNHQIHFFIHVNKKHISSEIHLRFI